MGQEYDEGHLWNEHPESGKVPLLQRYQLLPTTLFLQMELRLSNISLVGGRNWREYLALSSMWAGYGIRRIGLFG